MVGRWLGAARAVDGHRTAGSARTERARTGRRLAVAGLVAALVAGALPGIATAAPDSCRVVIVRTGAAYGALTVALDDVVDGDRLTLRGRCQGQVTIQTDLRIDGVTAAGSGVPRIVSAVGPVVFVSTGIALTVRGVAISGGHGGGGLPGALLVAPGAIVRLTDTTVEESGGDDRGAIESQGTLVIGGRSLVRGNAGGGSSGGGIDVTAGATTIGGRTRITENSAPNGGGVRVWPGGSLVVTGSARIDGNEATNGGGIAAIGTNAASAILVVKGAAQVTGNAASGVGGGIAGSYAAIRLLGTARIAGNSALADGGGVGGLAAGQTLLDLRGHVTIAQNTAPYGGGIGGRNGQVRVDGGPGTPVRILGNTATTGDGGGIAQTYGLIWLDGAVLVRGNHAPGGLGGGVYGNQLISLRLADDAVVSGNDALQGGGVATGPGGASVALIGAAAVRGNAAANDGGGIRVLAGALYLGGTSRVTGNEAGGVGGGIWYHVSLTPTFADGTCATHVSGNTPDQLRRSTGAVSCD